MWTKVAKIGIWSHHQVLVFEWLRSKQIYTNIFAVQYFSYVVVRGWKACFKIDKFCIEDEDQSRRSLFVYSPIYMDAVHDTTLSDGRIRVRTGIWGTEYSIWTLPSYSSHRQTWQKFLQKGFRNICNVFVDQSHVRVEASPSMCAWFETDADSLNPVVTMDHTLIHFYQNQKKRNGDTLIHQSVRNLVFRSLLALIFLDHEEVITTDFLYMGRTITNDSYSTLLTNLRAKIAYRRHERLVFAAQYSCTQIVWFHANNLWSRVRITRAPSLFTNSGFVQL